MWIFLSSEAQFRSLCRFGLHSSAQRAARMLKAAVLGLCVCHLVGAGIFARKERNGSSGGGADAAQSAGYLSEGRQRPLFARRRQHERHKPGVLKHNVASGFPSGLSPASKAASKPTKLKCSQLTQSCLPKSGCCDPCTTCHCRFFKTICFCRRTGRGNVGGRSKVHAPHHEGLSNRPRGQKVPGPQSK